MRTPARSAADQRRPTTDGQRWQTTRGFGETRTSERTDDDRIGSRRRRNPAPRLGSNQADGGLKRNEAAAISASKRSQRAERSRAESTIGGLDRASAHAQGPESPDGLVAFRRLNPAGGGGIRRPAAAIQRGTRLRAESRRGGEDQIEEKQQQGRSVEGWTLDNSDQWPRRWQEWTARLTCGGGAEEQRRYRR